MNILINYAHGQYVKSQKACSKSALDIGGFDKVIEYGYDDIDENFRKENAHILDQPRGVGYWVWKPYFILKTLHQINNDDILMYIDSGTLFIDSFNKFIDICKNDEKGVVLFQLVGHINQTWTKRDCFHYMNCENLKSVKAFQMAGTFLLFRKNDFVINFVSEWLEYCKDERIITDKENTCGKPNFPNFRDHRHDQSILSLLQVKYDIKTFIDPSQWGESERENGFKQLIDHHRKRWE